MMDLVIQKHTCYKKMLYRNEKIKDRLIHKIEN